MTDLVVERVVHGGDDRLVVRHDAVLDLCLHLEQRQLIVEGHEEAVEPVVEVQRAEDCSNMAHQPYLYKRNTA